MTADNPTRNITRDNFDPAVVLQSLREDIPIDPIRLLEEACHALVRERCVTANARTVAANLLQDLS